MSTTVELCPRVREGRQNKALVISNQTEKWVCNSWENRISIRISIAVEFKRHKFQSFIATDLSVSVVSSAENHKTQYSTQPAPAR